jgi:DNA-binding transcriptional LysR family regulator
MKNGDVFFLVVRSLDLVALHIFKTVADEGGISKAAAKLNRVQSNVTTRVKQLEARLGTSLFHRRKRRLILSPEGRVLLGYAATRLPAVLSRYHLAYPDVRIELVTGTTGALIARVLQDDLEAAFVAEPFDAQHLESQPAFRERLALITPKSFPAIRGPKDIGRRTLIAFSTGCTYRRCLEEWLTRAQVAPERIMEFSSYHAIVACVAAGAGVALVPRSVIHTVPGGRQVTIAPFRSGRARTRTMLVWRRGHRSPALDAMRKAVGISRATR